MFSLPFFSGAVFAVNYLFCILQDLNSDKSVTHRLVVVNFTYFRDGQLEEDRQGMAAVWWRRSMVWSGGDRQGAVAERKREINDVLRDQDKLVKRRQGKKKYMDENMRQ